MADRYYDNQTGLMHVVAKENSIGLGTLDSKSISVNAQSNFTDGDSMLEITPAKLIKADFRATISGTKGNLCLGVVDTSVNTASVNTIDDYDEIEGFPIDFVCFTASGNSDFNYRKVWKPNKYAQSGDMDLHMTIDPTGLFGIFTVWSYSMSLYTIWKPL